MSSSILACLCIFNRYCIIDVVLEM